MCSTESFGGASAPRDPACPRSTVRVISAACEVTTWLAQWSPPGAISETPEAGCDPRVRLGCAHLPEEGQAPRHTPGVLSKHPSSPQLLFELLLLPPRHTVAATRCPAGQLPHRRGSSPTPHLPTASPHCRSMGTRVRRAPLLPLITFPASPGMIECGSTHSLPGQSIPSA